MTASAPQHDDSFDAVRLGAAALVLVSHQFALLGFAQPMLLGETLGTCGVYVFFAISGFLVIQSWERDPHLARFFARRALRLFPALAVVVLLTVFVLGPAVSTLKAGQYFGAAQTWRYLENIALSHQLHLPGVFAANPHPRAVNNSLWSLQPEMLMYCLLAAAGVLAIRMPVYLLAGVAAALVALLLKRQESFPYQPVVALGAYFSAGMVLYRARARLLNARALALASLAAAAFALAGAAPFALWLVLPLATLLAAHLRPPAFKSRLLFGDWSYGIYLYAYPVQQTLVHAGVRDLALSLALSSAITLGLAMLSWQLVEARALRLKPRGPGIAAPRPLAAPA